MVEFKFRDPGPNVGPSSANRTQIMNAHATYFSILAMCILSRQDKKIQHYAVESVWTALLFRSPCAAKNLHINQAYFFPIA